MYKSTSGFYIEWFFLVVSRFSCSLPKSSRFQKMNVHVCKAEKLEVTREERQATTFTPEENFLKVKEVKMRTSDPNLAFLLPEFSTETHV